MTTSEDFYAKYVAQGCWTRCLQCQKDDNVTYRIPSIFVPEQSRSARTHGLACSTCTPGRKILESEGYTPWLDALECNSHGCSACLHIFPAKHWTRAVLQNHTAPSRARKLICKECVNKGFAPDKLTKHTCEQCERELGSLMFPRDVLKNARNQKGSQAVCKDRNPYFKNQSIFNDSGTRKLKCFAG